MERGILATVGGFGVAAGLALAWVPQARGDEGKTTYTSDYTVKSSSVVKLGEGRSQSIVELTGLNRNDAGADMFNNMTVRCVGSASTNGGVSGQRGAFTEVDKDGHEVFTTYVGTTATKPPGGAHAIIGGTGKYAGMSGEARFTVHCLKPPAEGVVMFAVPHEVVWKRP